MIYNLKNDLCDEDLKKKPAISGFSMFTKAGFWPRSMFSQQPGGEESCMQTAALPVLCQRVQLRKSWGKWFELTLELKWFGNRSQIPHRGGVGVRWITKSYGSSCSLWIRWVWEWGWSDSTDYTRRSWSVHSPVYSYTTIDHLRLV